jgi:hypothetical protein
MKQKYFKQVEKIKRGIHKRVVEGYIDLQLNREIYFLIMAS